MLVEFLLNNFVKLDFYMGIVCPICMLECLCQIIQFHISRSYDSKCMTYLSQCTCGIFILPTVQFNILSPFSVKGNVCIIAKPGKELAIPDGAVIQDQVKNHSKLPRVCFMNVMAYDP